MPSASPPPCPHAVYGPATPTNPVLPPCLFPTLLSMYICLMIMFLLVHGEIHSNKEEVCLADNQLFVTPRIKYSVSKPIMPCNNVSMSIIIIIIILIIILSRFLYSAFHIVSMRFTTDGGLFQRLLQPSSLQSWGVSILVCYTSNLKLAVEPGNNPLLLRRVLQVLYCPPWTACSRPQV